MTWNFLKIAPLFNFSFSTLRGLHSIRRYFKTSSVPMRCLSSKNPRNKSIIKQNSMISRSRRVITSFTDVPQTDPVMEIIPNISRHPNNYSSQSSRVQNLSTQSSRITSNPIGNNFISY